VPKSHIIEIKCPIKGKKKCAYDVVCELPWITKDVNGNFNLKKKHEYFCQVQIGLFITCIIVIL